MRRSPTVLALALVFAVLATPRPARAVCGQITMDVFNLADRAPQIAVVRGAADGSLQLERVLRGDASIWAHAPRPPPPTPPVVPRRVGQTLFIALEECPPVQTFELPGVRAVVFATAEARPLNPYGPSMVPLADRRHRRDAGGFDALPTIDALAQWLTRDADQRVALVLQLSSRGDSLAREALRYVGTSPAMLSRLRPADRAAIVHACETVLAASVPEEIAFDLAITLARLHEPAGEAAFERALLSSDGIEGGAPRRRDLQVLFANHVPGPPGAPDAGADLSLYSPAVAHADRDQRLLAGFRERRVAISDLADVRALAAVIRTGPDRIDRIVATDLCEQRLGVKLASRGPPRDLGPFLTQGSALFEVVDDRAWDIVATQCVTGAAASR